MLTCEPEAAAQLLGMQLAVVSGEVASGATVKEVGGEVPAVFVAVTLKEPLVVVVAVRVYVAENGALASAPPARHSGDRWEVHRGRA